MENIKKYEIKKGINLYHIKEEKFKTAAVSVNIHRPLNTDEASLNALLCDVLKRGSKEYKNILEISDFLQGMYGAYFNADVSRKGENHILSFRTSFVSDRYLKGDSCTKPMLDFLFDIILNPDTENGVFREEYVSQEKTNLINDIQALINDKRSYSAWRLIELMCEGDNYGTYELGSVESVQKIDAKNLFEHYKRIISSSPISIFVTGDTDVAQIMEILTDKLKNIEPKAEFEPILNIYDKHNEKREIVEKFDVTQAKLCIGLRTNISPLEDSYTALMVLNGILGGGAHSKLFNNVREKLSLAYYASSRLERYKGIMLIGSGIEIANKQKALDEIFIQIDDIKSGKITDYEFDSTVKSIVNSLRSFSDDMGYIEDYYLGQIMLESSVSLEQLCDKVLDVTKEDVVRAAHKLEVDTVYFLTAKEA